MSAVGGFSFTSPVALTSSLSVLLATTCSALSCTGFTCSGTITWGGVIYNAPTSANAGNTYPTLLSIKADGVTEVGRILDFHSGSAQTSEDFTTRLTASASALDCNTAFTSLKHAGTAYPIDAVSVDTIPVQLPLGGVKDVYGGVSTPGSMSLRTNFTGWFQVHVAWETTTLNSAAYRTDLRKNGTTVAQSRLSGGGQLSQSLYLLSGDLLSVWISLPDAIAPQQVDVTSTRTYLTVVQL